MKPIALVTAREAVGLDEDLPPLLAALRAEGAAAEAVVWDDPAADWARYSLAVLRSTWDYWPLGVLLKRNALIVMMSVELIGA